MALSKAAAGAKAKRIFELASKCVLLACYVTMIQAEPNRWTFSDLRTTVFDGTGLAVIIR